MPRKDTVVPAGLPEPWSYSIGVNPHKVTAYEDLSRKGVLYLKWRIEIAGVQPGDPSHTDWCRRSLSAKLRDAKGRIVREQEQRARAEAERQYQRLIGGVTAASDAPRRELTIAEGWDLATHPEKGKWHKDTMHRREMARVMNRVKAIWGARRTWNSIQRGDIRQLWRRELQRLRAVGKDGVRSAEIIVARVMALASWLRDEQLIDQTACLPWKAMWTELAEDTGDYTPHRPRYSIAEYLAILDVAPSIDPRWGLLLEVGAEYRLGQVVRMQRTHVAQRIVPRDVPGPNGTTETKDVTITLVTVPGHGKKKGAIVELTEAQATALWHALEKGHLRRLERAYLADKVPDYPLFGGGRMVADLTRQEPVAKVRHATRPPLDGTQLRTWLRLSEERAVVDGQPIAHVDGRGWYGLRRAALDAAKAAKISREGMQMSGGWSDAQIPDTIYADPEMEYARAEAAEVRGRVRRGEMTTPATPASRQSKRAPTRTTPKPKPKGRRRG